MANIAKNALKELWEQLGGKTEILGLDPKLMEKIEDVLRFDDQIINKEQREAVRAIYQKTCGVDDIEIDEDAIIAHGEGGAFVEAWVWLPISEDDDSTGDAA